MFPKEKRRSQMKDKRRLKKRRKDKLKKRLRSQCHQVKWLIQGKEE